MMSCRCLFLASGSAGAGSALQAAAGGRRSNPPVPVYVRDIGIEIPAAALQPDISLRPTRVASRCCRRALPRRGHRLSRERRGCHLSRHSRHRPFTNSAGENLNSRPAIRSRRQEQYRSVGTWKYPNPPPGLAERHGESSQLDADAARRNRRPGWSNHYAQGRSSAAQRRQAGRVFVRGLKKADAPLTKDAAHPG